MPEADIEPMRGVPTLDSLESTDEERVAALGRTAVVKVNGGLGTSMGLSGPKSVLEVREGLTFLDVIARQVLALRERHGVQIPLLLMNSFRTGRRLSRCWRPMPSCRSTGLPLDFVQSAEPKLRADDLAPVSWADNPDLEWCPPGHGDIYVSLVASGMLDTLRDKGIRYAFLSNSDNLGATCDPAIPAWMARESIPSCPRCASGPSTTARVATSPCAAAMAGWCCGSPRWWPRARTSTSRTPAGTPCSTPTTCGSTSTSSRQVLDSRDGVMGLPIIVNHKTVDPSRKDSTPVIQIESAMGTAIEVFDGSRAVHVPRSRFRPVKTTNELLLLRSDLYGFGDGFQIAAQTEGPTPHRPRRPLQAHRRLRRAVPRGAPSLRECTSLRVHGDVTFGGDIRCVGDVVVEADEPQTIPDGTNLQPSGR